MIGGKVGLNMANVMAWLLSHKTYFVCVAAILTALVSWLNNAMDTGQFIAAVFAAVAVITTRSGITSEAKKAGTDTVDKIDAKL